MSVATQSRGPGRPRSGAPPVAPDEELLPAALEHFAEKGFGGTSVRDLCRRLGASHNLVHQRFGSKEQLWFAAVDHAFATLAADLGSAIGDDLSDDLDRLRAVLVRFVEVTAGAPSLVRVMNQESVRPGPRLDYMFNRYIGPAARIVSEVLARLEAAGRIRHVRADTVHFLVANGAAGRFGAPALAAKLAGLDAPGDAESTSRYAHDVVDMIIAGLVREPSA